MGLHTTNEVQAFTTHRAYPGGPRAWIRSGKYGDLCIAGNICIFCSIWLSNGFLLYRAIVYYNTRQWILIPPFLLYIGSLVTGGLYIAEHFDHNSEIKQAAFAVPSVICAALCNIAIVFTIALRLLWYRHLVRQVVGRGRKEHREPYNSMLAILVESAGLYATFSVVYIISYTLHSVVARMVVATLVNVRGISSFLIILRLVKQHSSNETSRLDTGNGVTMTQCMTGFTDHARSVQTGESETGDPTTPSSVLMKPCSPHT